MRESILMTALCLLIWATPSSAQTGQATVPQISAGGPSASVGQLPRSSRAIQPVNRGQGTDGGQTATSAAAPARFIFDLGAVQEDAPSLPTVRDGVRGRASAMDDSG